MVLTVLLLVGCGDDDEATEVDAPAPVTKGDYVEALLETIECMEEAGITASSHEQSDGSFGIQIGSPSRGVVAEARIDEVYRSCTDEHLNEVQSAYLDTVRPSSDEAMELTRRCLVERGDLPADATIDDLRAFWEADPEHERLVECRSAAYTTTTTTAASG